MSLMNRHYTKVNPQTAVGNVRGKKVNALPAIELNTDSLQNSIEDASQSVMYSETSKNKRTKNLFKN